MMDVWTRVIAHVDMDAFFAAIEQLVNPEYRGKPVIVGAAPKEGKGRGVVSTASYEARPFGVHSAMPIARAYKLCPQGIFVKPNGKLYSQYSKQVFEILGRFTPLIQPVSVDEAFLDLTGTLHLYGDVDTLGHAMKEAIFDETGLTASIGISPSKSVSKIASDFDKPDGLTIVAPEGVQEFLDPLEVRRIWGVGKKAYASLANMGIETIAQLRAYPEELLEQRFGKWGPHLYRMARGIDNREVHDRDAAKSVSHERTFFSDQTDTELLLSTLMSLAENVCSRMRKYGLEGRTVQLKIRFQDFSTFTRSKTLPDYTSLTEEVYGVARRMFEKFDHKSRSVRLLGVGVSQLQKEGGRQINFLKEEDERKMALERVLDQLQGRFGKSALTHAQALGAKRKKKGNK